MNHSKIQLRFLENYILIELKSKFSIKNEYFLDITNDKNIIKNIDIFLT